MGVLGMTNWKKENLSIHFHAVCRLINEIGSQCFEVRIRIAILTTLTIYICRKKRINECSPVSCLEKMNNASRDEVEQKRKKV